MNHAVLSSLLLLAPALPEPPPALKVVRVELSVRAERDGFLSVRARELELSGAHSSPRRIRLRGTAGGEPVEFEPRLERRDDADARVERWNAGTLALEPASRPNSFRVAGPGFSARLDAVTASDGPHYELEGGGLSLRSSGRAPNILWSGTAAPVWTARRLAELSALLTALQLEPPRRVRR